MEPQEQEPKTERNDKVTRVRIDSIAEAYRRWGVRTLVVLVLIVLFQFVLGGISIYLWDQNKERQEDTKQAIIIGQLSRCNDSNTRHDASVKALDKVISDGVKAGRIDPDRAVATRANNLVLIDALQPKRNCKAEIESLGLGSFDILKKEGAK